MKEEQHSAGEKMEIEESAARTSIGFPLGLTILFSLLLFIVCFFGCCLHWDKLRSLLHSSALINLQRQAHLPSPPQKPVLPFVMIWQNQVQSLPVLMPGDQVPKFIAMACPCQPSRDKTSPIQVQ